jgi:protocatechuate 3,4-dioxygenase alpha subunit
MTGRAAPLVATSSQTVGPFFHVGPGASDATGRVASPQTPGEHITLAIRVLDGDGAAVPDAMLEIRQADAAGRYAEGPGFTGFGRLSTDADGWCRFATVKPGAPGGDDGVAQAPHVNVCLFARGLLRHLYTRLYFAGDEPLSTDPLLALVPADRRSTLVADRVEPSTWQLVIRLQGPGETVFFDV